MKRNHIRPIVLLSPAVKVLESLLLPTFNQHLSQAAHQHGFRKFHSTKTALHHICATITDGPNQKKPPSRTFAVALELSFEAFDTADTGILLGDVLDSTTPTDVKRWLCSYLRCRQFCVEFRDKCSKYRRVKQGVPQGGVLSPLLFNTYLAGIPAPSPGIQLVSYADDCTVLTSGGCRLRSFLH